jgi:deoxyribodipyrimidine photolyase-related protein
MTRRAEKPSRATATRPRLGVIFGDQLDLDALLLRTLDPATDVILMMEVADESTRAPSHVQRTVLFLSAMRHFARDLRRAGWNVRYVELDDPDNTHSFDGEARRAVAELDPSAIFCTHPGAWRVLEMVRDWEKAHSLPVTILGDEHFITPLDDFEEWARGRRSMIMEHFYRRQRKSTGYLMRDGEPVGGAWNYDRDNRLAFGADGPDPWPEPPLGFETDAVTRKVIRAVRAVLPDLPGRLDRIADFTWPVTRTDARAALDDFIRHRLPLFGPYEDAMWTDLPWVHHAILSPLLNLKLLNPRACCDAAIDAYERGHAPIQSVEAFVRQIIGWREFIRGVYWTEGPDYGNRNGLDEHGRLPDFYWSGGTDMVCLSQCVNQVLDHAYGHHIQRLMVMANFALVSGVLPRAVSDWFLGLFADGVEWATEPNVVGMALHADRRPGDPPHATGVVGTKPYAASGKYIQRMSNYCTACPYDPAQRSGPRACPFTVFYWDFLIRHADRFADNHRMRMILKNVERMSHEQRRDITRAARVLRLSLGIDPAP